VPAASSRSLLDWFRKAARPLPWRSQLPRDPYLVLLSEVMAQQTQIERVVPAYTAFLARFPTVEALAAASVDEVLLAFTGLGYYRRARSLHAAAREIAAAGRWPSTFEELRRLPGVGTYTAAAVAAFCFGGSEPPVDGNVARVAARVGAIALPLGSPALARRARAFAAELEAGQRSPLVFEALIELGATVCTPSAPRCPGCPLLPGCAAAAAGRPDAYPRPRPRRAIERHRWVAVWLERTNGDVLLARIAEGRLLAGLWLPPFAELSDGSSPAALARSLASLAGHQGPLEPASVVAHAVTHRRIEVMPFVGTVSADRVREARSDWGWHDPGRPTVGTSTLLAKLRAACSPPGLPRAGSGRSSA
jgi:A/G-specific adenine glycosylase